MRHETKKLIEKRVDTHVECDACGKRRAMEEMRTITGTGFDLPDGWRSFSTGHSDWGNDSVDSYERFDVCSAECYLDVLEREVGSYGWDRKRPTLRIDGFDYDFLKALLTAAGRGAPAKT